MLSYVTMAKISISSIEFVINILIQLGENILPSYEMLSFGSNKMHFTVVASHISHDGIWCALLPKMFSCIICFSKLSYESSMAYALNEYAPWNCILCVQHASKHDGLENIQSIMVYSWKHLPDIMHLILSKVIRLLKLMSTKMCYP